MSYLAKDAIYHSTACSPLRVLVGMRQSFTFSGLKKKTVLFHFTGEGTFHSTFAQGSVSEGCHKHQALIQTLFFFLFPNICC